MRDNSRRDDGVQKGPIEGLGGAHKRQAYPVQSLGTEVYTKGVKRPPTHPAEEEKNFDTMRGLSVLSSHS